MTTSGPSITEIIGFVTENEQKYTSLDLSHHATSGLELNSKQFSEIFEGLKTNTCVTEVKLEKMGMGDKDGITFGDVIASNSTITYVDIGYNKIKGDGMKAIGEALKTNSSIVEMKIHRQESDMGTAAENVIVELWKTNLTLQRLYATLHDRRCNQANTRGEVRNKEIAARIKAGKTYEDLDPATCEAWAAKQKEIAEEKKAALKLANAPVSAKVESTGGPYTLKQLTCKSEFLPDDIDKKKKETYLTDEEFESVFGMDREAFGALAKWKQNGQKKKFKLH